MPDSEVSLQTRLTEKSIDLINSRMIRGEGGIRAKVSNMTGKEIKESLEEFDAEFRRIDELKNLMVDTKKQIKGAILDGIA